DEQKPLRLRWQRLDSAREALLDPVRQRVRMRQAEAAGQLGWSQSSRQLQQRERIATRLGHESLDDFFVHSSRHRRLEERSGVCRAETFEYELRQTVEVLLLARPTNAEQHRNRVGLEAPRDERERGDGLPIQPLHVVDQADERALLGEMRQQAERRQADKKA